MFYPLDVEGVVRDANDPAAEVVEDLDVAGVEDAPALSTDAIDALKERRSPEGSPAES